MKLSKFFFRLFASIIVIFVTVVGFSAVYGSSTEELLDLTFSGLTLAALSLAAGVLFSIWED